jgi:hypothetical protein
VLTNSLPSTATLREYLIAAYWKIVLANPFLGVYVGKYNSLRHHCDTVITQLVCRFQSILWIPFTQRWIQNELFTGPIQATVFAYAKEYSMLIAADILKSEGGDKDIQIYLISPTNFKDISFNYHIFGCRSISLSIES